MTLAAGHVARHAVEPRLGSPWPGRELAQVRRTVRHAATFPLALLLGVQWFFGVAEGIPETAGLPARSWWLSQLAVLSVLDHPLPVGVLLLASAALTLLVRRGQHLGRAWPAVPAAVGTVAALGLLIACAVRGLGGSALAVIVLLVWLASTGWAVVHALLAGLAAREPVTTRTGAVLVLAWVVLVPGPLALGRWLLAGDLRAEAGVLAANTEGLRLSALLCSASVRLYLFGALLVVLAWLAHQCWPRGGVERRSWRWYAALAVCFVALVELWWTAQSATGQRVTELRYGDPADELHFTCATWVRPPDAGAPAATPTETVAVSGSACRTVTTYDGYHQVASTDVGVSVSPVALRAPAPAGSADEGDGRLSPLGPRPGAAGRPRELVGARYDDVVVLAGTNRFDRTADQLVAVRVRGGQVLWQFVCGQKQEVRARFTGGQTDPAVAPDDAADVVVLTCADRRLRLDPVTGLTAPR